MHPDLSTFPSCNPRFGRLSLQPMTRFLCLAILFSAGCIESRSYLTTRHRHLHYEVEVKPNIRKEIRVTHEVSDNRLTLFFEEISYCRHVQYDVEKMSLIRTETRPGSLYYMALGSLVAALSVPSYYMGIAKSSGTARAIHFSVGTGLFLGPGLALGGYGAWKFLEEETVSEDIGNVRREVKNTDFSCGQGPPPEGARVEVLTRTGHVDLGILPVNGRITADLARLSPMVNDQTGKAYLDVFVNSMRIGTIVISE